jgi:hypothetical protein
MPPFIALVLAGAGLYAGYKLMTKLVEQAQRESPAEVDRRRRETAAAKGGPKDLGELEWDSASGAYKPRKRES